MHGQRRPIRSAEEFGQWPLPPPLRAKLSFHRKRQSASPIAGQDCVVFRTAGPFIQSPRAFDGKGMAGAQVREEAIEAIARFLVQTFLVRAGLVEELLRIQCLYMTRRAARNFHEHRDAWLWVLHSQQCRSVRAEFGAPIPGGQSRLDPSANY